MIFFALEPAPEAKIAIRIIVVFQKFLKQQSCNFSV